MVYHLSFKVEKLKVFKDKLAEEGAAIKNEMEQIDMNAGVPSFIKEQQTVQQLKMAEEAAMAKKEAMMKNKEEVAMAMAKKQAMIEAMMIEKEVQLVAAEQEAFQMAHSQDHEKKEMLQAKLKAMKEKLAMVKLMQEAKSTQTSVVKSPQPFDYEKFPTLSLNKKLDCLTLEMVSDIELSETEQRVSSHDCLLDKIPKGTKKYETCQRIKGTVQCLS